MEHEKQIEEIKNEEDIKHNLDFNNKNKKNIIYIVIGILIFILITLIIYIVLDKNDSTLNDNDKVNENIQNFDEPVSNTEDNSVGYVSCDDNTSLLNVRNSVAGNIIDGLSCYKEVTIDEEIEGTETCENWYKITYQKNNNTYTGYACGIYIKKLEISKDVLEKTKQIIDKANNYYENNILTPYCGTTTDTKEINFKDNMKGEYAKSEYKTLEELKKYLLSFLDEDLLLTELELADIDNPKIYDNYYVLDDNLYCRNYSAKGWITYYTNNYDIEITSIEDNKIIVNVAYEYLKEDSECDLKDLSNCSKSNFIYEIGKIIIENDIITKIDFHK